MCRIRLERASPVTGICVVRTQMSGREGVKKSGTTEYTSSLPCLRHGGDFFVFSVQKARHNYGDNEKCEQVHTTVL